MWKVNRENVNVQNMWDMEDWTRINLFWIFHRTLIQFSPHGNWATDKRETSAAQSDENEVEVLWNL